MNSKVKSILRIIFYPLLTLKRNYYMHNLRNAVYNNPKKAVDMIWKKSMGHTIDWEHPRDLNEKISWLMAKTDIKCWARLADKYYVKEYLNQLGLGEYVPKLLGVWDDVEKINLKDLPDKFVLKCNHDCGSTYVIDQTTEFDFEEIKKQLKRHLEKPYGIDTVELHYHYIHPVVLAEEFLDNNNSNISSSIIDYKIWCFNGIPYYCLTCWDRDEDNLSLDLYDIKTWKPMHEYMASEYQNNKIIARPKHLDTMIYIATKLAQGFPQVRIDLHEVNDKVYFGEMTFTSAGGRMNYFSQKGLTEMGNLITLPKL